MPNKGNNTARRRDQAQSVPRKIPKWRIVAFLALSVVVCAAILGPKIITFFQAHMKKQPAVEAATSPPEDVPVTGEEYRNRKGYALEHTTDPATGDVNTRRVPVDEMLLRGNAAIMNRDFKNYKKIEKYFLDKGDEVVPDLGEILLCESKTELLTAVAGMLGKIGTDKAIGALLSYVNDRKTRPVNDQFIAATVVGAIASSGNKHTAEALRDIFEKGRNPSARAEAMKALAGTAKNEEWYKEALVKIANDQQAAGVLRASAIRQLTEMGNKEMAPVAMDAYFSMTDTGSKIEIIWSLDGSDAEGLGEFFSKVCAKETSVEILMEALPSWYKLHKDESPATLVAFLGDIYNRKLDPEVAKNVISILCQITDGKSLSLLQKMAKDDESEAVRNLANDGAKYLKGKMEQADHS